MKPKVTKRYLSLFTQSSQQRVLSVLFSSPEKEFSLSDLAKEAHVAKPHIGALLKELESLEFIKITKLTKIWRIKANQGNENFMRSKILHNLHFVYQSGLVEYLAEHFENPRAIILFGSFRKGDDISSSDIDIAIEMDVEKEYETKSLSELSEFEKHIKKKIQIHLFHRNTIDIHVFNNIANGIVLQGFLEVKP